MITSPTSYDQATTVQMTEVPKHLRQNTHRLCHANSYFVIVTCCQLKRCSHLVSLQHTDHIIALLYVVLFI